MTLDLTELPDGIYPVRIIALDEAGNSSPASTLVCGPAGPQSTFLDARKLFLHQEIGLKSAILKARCGGNSDLEDLIRGARSDLIRWRQTELPLGIPPFE